MIEAHRFTVEVLDKAHQLHLKNAFHNTTYPTVVCSEQPKLVFINDYNSDDEWNVQESNHVALVDPAAFVVFVSKMTAEDKLMMFENHHHPDYLDLPWYKCHLMNPSQAPELMGDYNNMIVMSGLTRLRFLGLNTIERHVPQLAIRFDRSGDQVTCMGGIRHIAHIVIECRTQASYAFTLKMMKEPYDRDDHTMEIRTFVTPPDLEVFIDCVTFKYHETKFIWLQLETSELNMDDDATAEVILCNSRDYARRQLSYQKVRKY
jgi:hypothetical protein